jgi:hypothetical protein
MQGVSILGATQIDLGTHHRPHQERSRRFKTWRLEQAAEAEALVYWRRGPMLLLIFLIQ